MRIALGAVGALISVGASLRFFDVVEVSLSETLPLGVAAAAATTAADDDVDVVVGFAATVSGELTF